MAEDTKKAAPKVFDIAPKPSASPTSRPVIVNHGPIMRDPTLVERKDEENPAVPKEGEKMMSTAKQIKIQPLDDDVKPEEDQPKEDAKDSPKKDQPSGEAPPETAAEESPAEAKVEAEEESKAAASESKPEAEPAVETATKNAVDDEPPKIPEAAATPPTNDEQQKQEAAAAEAALAHSKHIAELVTSQKFYLPINQVEKRRNRRVVIVGTVICLLLAVAWLDVALDAGLISNTYHLPHTSFFALKS